MIVRTLYIFLGIALVASLLVLGAFVFSGSQTTAVVSGVAGVVTCLIMLALMRAKRFEIPRYGLPLVVYGLTTYLITSGENLGIHDEANGIYFLAILLAGLLLGRKGIVIYGLLSTVTVMGVGFAEILRLLPNRMNSFTTLTTVIVVGVVYILVSLLAYLTVDALSQGLEQVRQSEAILAVSNKELEDARNTLEERVQERTEKAESALREAEDARHALEAQMWQISGQGELNEILRQGQGLQELSNNMLSFLCRYLELPVGTFYLLDGKTLRFTAGFGVHQGLKPEIALGEGVMGEAVQEKRMLTLDSLDSTQLRVVSGLGSQVPVVVVIIPLLMNDQPLGALEFGSLTPFRPEQIQFLSRIEESISMTIQTTQARGRLDELLLETQRQTEELQAQEEELRAANEELLVQTESLRNLRSEEQM
jgi:putative methionine-R-sulfoxide reductase with GAF domain